MVKWYHQEPIILQGHKTNVHGLRWHPDGRRLLSGSTDGQLRLWTPESHVNGKETKIGGTSERNSHSGSIEQIRWHPKGEDRAITVSGDKTLRLWDINSNKCVRKQSTPGENINASWSKDGRFIAVGDKDDNLTIMDAKEWKVLKQVKLPYEVNEMSWSEDSQLFYTVTAHGFEIRTWPHFELQDTLVAHSGGSVYVYDMDKNEESLYTSGADGLMCQWDMAHRVCVQTYSESDSIIRCLSLSYDSQYVVIGCENCEVTVLNAKTLRKVHSIPAPAVSNCVQMHPSRNVLAYAMGPELSRGVEISGRIRILGMSK